MSQRSTRKTKGALWAHAASKSAWDTNTGSFYQTSRGRSAPLPHTPPTRTHCRGAASEEILFGGGFGFPPGLPYRKRPYGSGAIFQVRWSGAASGARAAAARTGPYGQPLFSAGCKGPRAKIPLMGACACRPVPSGAVGFSSRRLHLQNTQINTMAANASFFQLCVARSGAGTR